MKIHYAANIIEGTFGEETASYLCNPYDCGHVIDTKRARDINHITTDKNKVTCGNCLRALGLDQLVIYTNERTLEEKQNREFASNSYWEFKRPPKDISKIKKVWFAVKGRVEGYFKVFDTDENSIDFESYTWTDCRKKIETKPFRGFRYRWW